MDLNDEIKKTLKKPKLFPLKRILWISLGVLFLLLVISSVLFFWGRDIKPGDPNYVLDHDVWGTLGDFAGGIFGLFLTLLTCILMIWTFYEQRDLTFNSNELEATLSKISSHQAELQRFNDLFFQLMVLYRDQNKDLNISVGQGDYFDKYKRILYHNTKKYTYQGNAYRFASELYLDFYGRHASELAPHFRILYRIFNLIDSSKISSDSKLEYAKIMRANLSESELFFLRYNCNTHYGEKFKNLVNKYRLLKHLPFLSLLEAKWLKEIVKANGNDVGINLNIIFYKVGKEIFDRIVGKKALSSKAFQIESSSKYNLWLHIPSTNRIVIRLDIDNNRKVNKRLKLLDSLNISELQRMMYEVVREILIFSNFGIYNPNIIIKKLEPRHYIPDPSTNITRLYVTVKNEIPIRLSHPEWDTLYGISNVSLLPLV